MLFGDGADGKRWVVAPYTEGRFGDGDKYYGIAAGRVDPGEDALKCALREAEEETGINFKKLLGKENIEKLRRGEKVENVDTPYKGVRIKRVVPEALDYIYNGRTDVPNHLTMFGIELEGIEHLRGQLKNKKWTSKNGEVDAIPALRWEVNDAARFPSLTQCLGALRDMKMPDAKWAKSMKDSPLKPMGNATNPDWFRKLEKEYNGGKEITTIPEWQRFRAKLPEADFETITDMAEQIKGNLKKLKIIGSDQGNLKFDTKDCPFKFYQEGADIISAETYLHTCLQRSVFRSDYNRAFCGATPKMQNSGRMERVNSAQLAAVVCVTPKQDIRAVAEDIGYYPFKTVKGQFLGGSIDDTERLKVDLLGIKETMNRKMKPIPVVLHPQHYGKGVEEVSAGMAV